MAESTTKQLRVFPEAGAESPAPPKANEIRTLPGLLKAFDEATGWSLRYASGSPPSPSNESTWSAPVNPGVGITPGHLDLVSTGSDPSRKRISESKATTLAGALGDTLGELCQYQNALWRSEAELASAMPFAPHEEDPSYLAERIVAALKGGAEAVDAQAAALYVLDEATTELKLRSAWGLPTEQLAEPARPLQAALADLEALLGHAVVLEDTRLMASWNPPQAEFASAVCVPVSTPNAIIGTLWVFGRQQRDYSERQTNVIEIVAGRIAADLEREVLIREGMDSLRLKQQLAAAERLQRGTLPNVPPLLDGWEMAAWVAQAGSVGGDFYDWFTLPGGTVAVVMGNAMNRGVEAALAAAGVKSAIRAHAQYLPDADRLLSQVNFTLWTGSAGDQYADVSLALIDPQTGRLAIGGAGPSGVMLLGPDSSKALTEPTPSLGDGPDTAYPQHDGTLDPGQAILMCSEGFREGPDEHGLSLDEAALAATLCEHLDKSAEDLVALAREYQQRHCAAPERRDRGVVIVKRTTA